MKQAPVKKEYNSECLKPAFCLIISICFFNAAIIDSACLARWFRRWRIDTDAIPWEFPDQLLN